jgi:flagellar biosynthesis/type III secretory pathway protein FliH
LGEPAAFHAFAPQWQPLFWDLASLSPRALLDSAEEWLQTLAVVRAEDASSEEFVNVYNAVLQRLEPLADKEPVRYYDLLRMILTWGLWRRPFEERDQLERASVASQRDAVRREEIRSMSQTIAQWYVEEGKKEGRKEGLTEGLKEGELRALRRTLRLLLEKRFQALPEALQQRIEATTDVEKLESCVDQVMHISHLEELQL